MNDTLVTLVGNAATGVEFRETATGGMARFRFAVTPRRWDREKQFWTDGHTSFYTVWAWRTLASNLSGSVSVGEPLVVHGRLKVREEEREGGRRTFVDIEAVAVGHDLTRGTAAFRRVMRGDPGLMTRSGSVGRTGDSGGSGRSGESEGAGGPDGSYDVSRAERVERVERAGRAGRREREEGGEQSEMSERAEQSDRAGRQGAKRSTVRQKGGQELASVP
ncbi:single-stranded DNA-binding protein [Streptomyces atratus]|uniref:Single-stranded DNA-binding protein n=1 Tax=Streptomyces atratus TaxID=1893 RepID=A0A2Z5JCL0_STRAR|nr:single-stranded DNA-binding protein [Streptomyces atratus]AXE77953.1 single-stranded DNA-binding protein [Streptomyces atratus]